MTSKHLFIHCSAGWLSRIVLLVLKLLIYLNHFALFPCFILKLFPGKRHLFVLDLLPVTVATCSYSHRYFLWSETCLQVVNTHKHTHTALCDAVSQIHYSAECCEGRPWPLWSSSLGSFHTLAWYKSNGNTMSVGYSRCEHVWWWITGHSRLRGRLLARTPIFLVSSMKLFCLSFPVFLPWRSDINI